MDMHRIIDTAQLDKVAAIAAASAKADRAWLRAAMAAVRHLATVLDEFTTDHVWACLPNDVRTHEPRAMGAVMRDAMKEGVIAPLDRYEMSTRPACHCRPVRVWKSLRREVWQSN